MEKETALTKLKPNLTDASPVVEDWAPGIMGKWLRRHGPVARGPHQNPGDLVAWLDRAG
jgi:hypothetical protein